MKHLHLAHYLLLISLIFGCSESADTSGATSADTSGATSADTSGATSADTSGSSGPDAGTREVFDGLAFRYIPPGSFTMGSPSDETGRFDDETQHEVTLTKGFWLKETEVTQSEWQAVMGSNPSEFTSCGRTCPVESVNWWDATQFLNTLSAMHGLTSCYALRGCSSTPGSECDTISEVANCTGYRLPTEAEWEYAYRAGSTTAFYNGGISQTTDCSVDSNLNAIGWYCGNASSTTHPVGGKAPNAWGIYDMAGNVWEWTWDWYATYPSGSQVDYRGPTNGPTHVERGGSWDDIAQSCRGALRDSFSDPNSRFNTLGLRPVRSY
jgi:formylglycine-generating enzyme required for sulfatase activity